MKKANRAIKVNTLFEDFMIIQKQLKPLIKEEEVSYATNRGQKTYKFTPLPKVWEDIKDIISDNNFIVINRSTSKGVKTIALHISGKELTSFIPYSSNTPQEKGSEITYYRRYNLGLIFNLIAEEDDNAGTVQEPFRSKAPQTAPQTAKSPQLAEPIWIREMKEKAKKKGFKSSKDLVDFLNTTCNYDIKELPRDRESVEKIISEI